LISDNYADIGGGVYATDGATINFKNVGIGHNEVTSKAGGLYFDKSATATMDFVVVLNNTVSDVLVDIFVIKGEGSTFINCSGQRDNNFCDFDAETGIAVEGSTDVIKYTNCITEANFDTDAIRCERFRNSPTY
jgi:hypothetical protein